MKNFFQGRLLKQATSKYNGCIKVFKFLGRIRLEVNDLIQSGGLLENIWRKALKSINNQQSTINNCLILGLGGGTAAKIVAEKFPKAKITGIEIDPVMIKLAKEYFDLNMIKNLKIINDDAIGFVSSIKNQVSKYDLILVDMYIGEKVPKKSENQQFLTILKKLISKNGIIIFNRLYYDEHKERTKKFIKKLGKYFKDIKLIHAWSNLILIVNSNFGLE